MADPKGFLKVRRKEAGNRPLHERIHDFGEVEQTLNSEDRKLQASRCMDCGVPFCHWACPVINIIPEWNDLLHRGDFKRASELLHSTNNFPEFTGRVCPAPCEDACVLSIDKAPVTIRENEAAITEMAFNEAYIKPRIPQRRTGKRVAVVGSGPAGLACAQQLNAAGHFVTIFEKEDAAGGLLRYGIPDFKLNKRIIDRRLNILQAEGIEIQTGKEVEKNIDIRELVDSFDAICLAIGAEQPRDLEVEGRHFDGIHFAMDFLRQQNKIIRGEEIKKEYLITAKGKNVVVVGGGDTGSDCVGTAIRQGAGSVTQIEILPRPEEIAGKENPYWPFNPQKLKISTSHEEGCERRWSLSTQKFIGDMQQVTGLELIGTEWQINDKGQMQMKEISGTEESLGADLILIAMGFLHPVQEGIISALDLDVNARKNIATDNKFATSHKKVFAAGDARNGASLVVSAIFSGREAAEAIDSYLRTS